MVKKSLWPLVLALVLEALAVENVVEVLKELKSDNAVIGGLVELDGGCTDLWVLVEDIVSPVGVEDLVYTRKVSPYNGERKLRSLLTMGSRHSASMPHP